MSEQPLISVIIPAYNASEYISKCLESIQNNSYKNLEILVINDGSMDTTREIVESYCEKDNRIVLVNKENGGVSSARNAGIDVAKGEYISFVDSDDYIDKDYFKTLLNTFDEETDIVCCRHLCVDKHGNDLGVKYYCPENSFSLTGHDIANYYFGLVTGVINSCCVKLYKRSLLADIRFSQTLKWGEDASFNLEVFKKIKKMIVVPDKIYFYTLYNGQTITKKIKGYGEMLLEYVGNIDDFLDFYNAYENVKIRKGMGGRCVSDFFVAATHSDSLKEYKSVFLKLKNAEWYKYINEATPGKRLFRVVYKLILADNYVVLYFINKLYDLLIKVKRKLKHLLHKLFR